MIKSIGKLTLAALMAAVIASAPLTVSAQTTNAPAAKAAHPSTFHTTKIIAVDKAAKTISLGDKGQHVLQVTGESKIYIDKKPATFDDVTVGQSASGSYTKTADGKFNLKTLNIRSAPAAK